MKYTAKTLFSGYRIGLHYPDLFVGVPDVYFKSCPTVEVLHRNEKMTVSTADRPVLENTFADKFRAGRSYTLKYFCWEPK